MRVVVMADTHLRAAAGGGGRPSPLLPEPIARCIRGADVILHAGDVVTPEVLDELATFAPVFAVLGNNDHALLGMLPETLEIELDGVPIAVIHDGGARDGREARLHRRFPDARLVVYGHSHLPDDRIGVGRQRLFNPGSPTQRRRAPSRTFGVVGVRGGRITSHRIVPLPDA